MSITINNQKGFSRVYQQVWVRRFGLLIQKRRKKSGHSPEKEARWVPATLEHFSYRCTPYPECLNQAFALS